jgi:hypothetical protein
MKLERNFLSMQHNLEFIYTIDALAISTKQQLVMLIILHRFKNFLLNFQDLSIVFLVPI